MAAHPSGAVLGARSDLRGGETCRAGGTATHGRGRGPGTGVDGDGVSMVLVATGHHVLAGCGPVRLCSAVVVRCEDVHAVRPASRADARTAAVHLPA